MVAVTGDMVSAGGGPRLVTTHEGRPVGRPKWDPWPPDSPGLVLGYTQPETIVS